MVAVPAAVVGDGMVKVLFAPTIADPSAPKLTELSGAGVLDVSCYLTADGWNPGATDAAIEDKRLCQTQDFQRPGRQANTLSIKYVYNPASPTNDEARIKFARLTTGFFVVRYGVDAQDAFAVDDIVDVIPLQMGTPVKDPIVENGVLTITQQVFVTGPVESDVEVVTA